MVPPPSDKKEERTQEKIYPMDPQQPKKTDNTSNPPPPPPPQTQPTGTKKNIPEEVISVLFVPRTQHSKLAKMIRRYEQTISKLSGYKIKIVEHCGTKLIDLLRNKGPDYTQLCNRENCHLCKLKIGQPRRRFPCWDRSVLY